MPETVTIPVCPRCGNFVSTTGPDPWHMAMCRGLAGCGWWGRVEQCDRKEANHA